MKRILIILLLAILSFQISNAQNIDSLRLVLKTETHDSVKTSIYNSLGGFYYNNSEYDSAHYFYLKSYKIANKKQDTNQIIWTQYQIAKILYWTSFDNKADSLFNKVLKLSEYINDTTFIIRINNGMGPVKLRIGDTIAAINHLKYALKMCRTKDVSRKGLIYANLGQIERNFGNLDKSLGYFDLSKQMWEEINATDYIARIKFEKAKIFFEKEEYKQAIHFYWQSIEMDTVKPDRTILSWKYKRLSEAYIEITKFDSAYYFLEKHHLMQKDIHGADVMKNIKDIEIKYETELKNKENINLKKENILNKQIIKNKDYLFTGSMIIIFLVILIIIILYRTYRNVKSNNILLEKQKNDIKTQSETLEETNEQLKELDKYKQTLTAMLIHDLSNPLHIIKASTIDDNIISTANQMILMVDNLLTIQKFEDKNLCLEMFDYQLIYLADKAVSQILILAKKKNIELVNNISANIFINADSLLLERVFINLISNAIRFTDSKGKIIIDAKIIENTRVLVSVKDTGIGIPEDKIEFVFDKYSKSKTENKTGSQNYGLGLNFCKIAVESMDGKICVKSKEGEGSLFRFSINGGSKQNIEAPISKPKAIELNESISFTDAEKQQISVLLTKIQQYEIYELTEIKVILNRIKKLEGENIKKWLVLFENALYSSNEELFNQLINIK